MTEFSVSAYLKEKHGSKIPEKGQKFECPYCGHPTMSLKGDKLAKCFHPSCGRFVSAGSAQSGKFHFQQFLWKVMEVCHEELVAQSQEPDKFDHAVWRYFTQERKIDPKVIIESPVLGAVPRMLSGQVQLTEKVSSEEDSQDPVLKSKESLATSNQFDFLGLSRKYRQLLQEEGDAKTIEDELKYFDYNTKKLEKLIRKNPGRLVFGYTDAGQHLCSFKFREPFGKNMCMFKHGKNIGVFNPYLFDTKENESFPYIVLAEGEFNILALQSLARKNNDPWYKALALGGASSVDWETLAYYKEQWFFFEDNDEAGRALTKKIQSKRTYRLVRFTFPNEDLDSFIHRQNSPQKALDALKKLIRDSKHRYRFLDAIAHEIKSVRQKSKKQIPAFEINQDVGKLVVRECMDRGKFYKTAIAPYFLDKETRKLYLLSTSSQTTKLYLHDFGLNPTETIHKFVMAELEKYACEEGEEANIYQFVHYDKKHNKLYLFNKDTEIYRISPSAIETVVNGTDGVLFEPLPGYQPFTRQPEVTLDMHLLSILYINQINWEQGALQEWECERLLEAWFSHLFFDELHPTHPIAAFIGPKGSSKTSSVRRLGMLLLGSKFQVSAMPEKPDDFDAIITNGFLVGFDNVDGQTDWMNDKLAIAATGGTVRRRELYTTNHMVEFNIRAQVAITSRTPKFRRDDVAERLLIFPLKVLDKKISEQRLMEEALGERDRFMSWLLLRLQEILIALEKTENIPVIETELRMADFATFMLRLAMAESPRAEADTRLLLERLSSAQSQFTLEQEPLFELLNVLAVQYPGQLFSAKDLHQELGRIAHAMDIPYTFKSSNTLGQKLGHLKSNLSQTLDMQVKTGAHNVKVYTFSPKPEELLTS